ncbi:MAG: DUF1887 family protein [Oscillospiraceae bacterium]|nr:DUF1887 family protein [Oscillospiraceae bacterium]
MTYVEFFDKTAAENLCACLTYKPERVIYIGGNAKAMNRHIKRYEAVFGARGEAVEFLYRAVSRINLQEIVDVLQEIVETYDDCVFDITGGEELYLLALGMVYAKNPERKLQIHRMNLQSNAVYICDKDGNTIGKELPKLTVEENIQIYGGDVIYGTVDEEKTYAWEITPEFCEDVDLIWSICREHARYWNAQIAMFAAVNAIGTVSEDGLITVVSKETLTEYLEKNGFWYGVKKSIVKGLLKYGLLTCFDESDGMVTIAYKDAQVKRCLTKAGQALEMKVYLIAQSLADETGALVYDDAKNGVLIDWDGEWHEDVPNVYDTVNEIDVLLMHGMIPVFISCKNGVITSDELYKLWTVAERFGGKYAKRVLVASSIDFLGEAGEYLRQRAKDMEIRLIENAQDLDDVALAAKLKTLWCN